MKHVLFMSALAMSLGACGSEGIFPPDNNVPPGGYCSPTANWDPAWSDFEVEVLNLVNDARGESRSCGGNYYDATGPLQMESRLRCAARRHSRDMGNRDFFEHENPDGEDVSDRAERAGYTQWRAIAENIAAGQNTASQVVTGWLNSSGHCRNIMNPQLEDIGIGFYDPSNSTTVFTPLWTQVFGTEM